MQNCKNSRLGRKRGGGGGYKQIQTPKTADFELQWDLELVDITDIASGVQVQLTHYWSCLDDLQKWPEFWVICHRMRGFCEVY